MSDDFFSLTSVKNNLSCGVLGWQAVQLGTIAMGDLILVVSIFAIGTGCALRSPSIFFAIFAGALSVGSADARSRSPQDSNLLTPIVDASPTLAPFQHVRFCLRYPSDCKIQLAIMLSGRPSCWQPSATEYTCRLIQPRVRCMSARTPEYVFLPRGEPSSMQSRKCPAHFERLIPSPAPRNVRSGIWSFIRASNRALISWSYYDRISF
jgi:hypothetical protein